MRKDKFFVEHAFGHYSSIFLFLLVFLLIVATAILSVLYTSGVLSIGSSSPVQFSISAAYCNSSGVFIWLKNNFNAAEMLSNVYLILPNESLAMTPIGASGYAVQPKGSIELHSVVYNCPAFNTLANINLKFTFNSTENIAYAFGPNYWDSTLLNTNSTSKTVSVS